ncbi:MAG: hypothetical protein NW201_05780, partial [Gemmatimonadales bacterium]|nr:hypothetical protein [Gemmatimonadales bacterium]
TAAERAAVCTRLGTADEPLAPALERLGAVPEADWPAAVERCARAVDSAWRALEADAAAELDRWAPAVARVAAYRRPWWPVLLAGAPLVALGAWCGLLVGGWLPVPPALRGWVELVWAWEQAP